LERFKLKILRKRKWEWGVPLITGLVVVINSCQNNFGDQPKESNVKIAYGTGQ